MDNSNDCFVFSHSICVRYNGVTPNKSNLGNGQSKRSNDEQHVKQRLFVGTVTDNNYCSVSYRSIYDYKTGILTEVK